MAKVGKNSLTFDNVYLHESAVVVGPKEYEGPLKDDYDNHFDDLRCGQKSWELAEILMYRNAFNICLNKNNLDVKDLDCVVSGDLNNQIIIGNYVLRDYDVPYLGVFNACSSSVEGLIVASNLIAAQGFTKIIVAISSHNATAERQYRYPTEYGGQKPESMTSTVTAAASTLVSNQPSLIKITKATVGRVVDAKINDALDMGRAMAPAAYHTLNQHFLDFNVNPSEYDLILTGDLSYYGSDMLLKIFHEYNIDLSINHNDGGLMIYDRKRQNVFSGGSGCGCLPAVMYSHVIKKMLKGELNKVLCVGTGALLNPIILAQKETIPAIAHAVVIERVLQ
jgi:stage V sporulation protein AD